MIPQSQKAERTTNPIRKIVDNLNPDPNHPKSLLNLALGDPTIFGDHLQCPAVLRDTMIDLLMSSRGNGYLPSVGSVDARKSIAQYTNQQALTFHHYLASTQQQNHTKSSSATLSGNSSSSNSNEGTSNNSYYPNPNPNPIPDSSINKTDNNDNDDESMLEVVTKAINTPSRKVTEEDVIIASGCSGAVELAISVLLNPGDNILVPCPGFPLYQVITESMGGSIKRYPLMPDSSWEIDMEALDSLVDSRTKAILINNPSNPCGSSYSLQHISKVVAVAKKYRLPIIADEIYSGIVFDGEFCPFHLMCDEVPVITLGGIAKEFLVPGWRVGWIVVHDSENTMSEIRKGLKSLTQLIIGANSLVQLAIPSILSPIKGSKEDISIQKFKFKYINILQSNIQLCHQMITQSKSPYLSITSLPKGALYIMIKIHFEAMIENVFSSDTDFSEKLLQSENLVVLPGQCFGMSGYIRLVICPPYEILQMALTRLIDFCYRHRRMNDTTITDAGAAVESNLINYDSILSSSSSSISNSRGDTNDTVDNNNSNNKRLKI